ncbi:hypothetical protein [Pandoraea apista]|uniref:hypothetical protein n=1 Tax=Pandoraea apista TaxID=93218 RepID=UPI000AF6B7B2|nr:hypothetical protein [Pandoraea apista]
MATVSVSMALGACAATPSNERETGSAGQLFRYSSRQVSVDLTDAQRETLRSLRDRRFPGSTSMQMLDAIAATLAKQGFAPVTVDRDTEMVEAERHTVLVPKWREILRGALKSRVGALPGKPDHERLAAIVAVRASGEGAGLLVRVRFDRTVWDSNGDARTETVLERDVYEGFFAGVDKSLNGEAKPSP